MVRKFINCVHREQRPPIEGPYPVAGEAHAARQREATPAELALGNCRLYFLFQKRNDDGDSLLGLLLHDPVARIVDDRAANVRGGKTDFCC
jgi:hypothetical protein